MNRWFAFLVLVPFLFFLGSYERSSLAFEDESLKTSDVPAFGGFDKNSDGKLDPEEIDIPEAVFKSFDEDQDGYISKDEFDKRIWEELFMKLLLEKMKDKINDRLVVSLFKGVLDTDSDKRLSKEELHRNYPAIFGSLDKDNDGFISLKDLEEGLSNRGESEGMPNPVERFFNCLDENNDNKVSREEFSGKFKNLLLKLDKNSDGFISLEEYSLRTVVEDLKREVIHMYMKAQEEDRLRRMMRKFWPHFDRENKGSFSKETLEKNLGKVFEMLDSNNDGTILQGELTKEAQKNPKLAVQNKDLLISLDKDGDRQVTRDEFHTRFCRAFDRLNKNEDDVLTKEEVKSKVKF